MSEPNDDDVLDSTMLEEKHASANIEKEKWQKDLDRAIEEKRLADFMPSLYPFDAQTWEYEIERFGVKYKHRFKAPEQNDEIRKEAMAVTIRRNAGRFQGDPLVESFRDDANAQRRFYDGLATAVWGYPIEDEGDDGERWIDVSYVVEKYVAEEGEETNGNHDKTLLDFIPEADKLLAARKVHGGACYVIAEKGKRIRSIRQRREYIVKELFGIEVDDDGEATKPTHVVAYHFAEGSAKDIGAFDTKCQPSKTHIKNEGQPEQRATIDVVAAGHLFDNLINYIQGASIDGKEVLTIAKGDPRLAKVPDRCKTDALFVYMNFLKS